MTEFHFNSEEIDDKIWNKDAEIISMLEPLRQERMFNIRVNEIKIAMGAELVKK